MRNTLVSAIAAALLLTTQLVPAAAAGCSTYGQRRWGSTGRSYTFYNFPSASVGPNGGWKSLPGPDKVCGAILHRNVKLPKASAELTIPVYESVVDDPSQVLRIVIGSEAKGRDAWTYFTSFNNAKKKAYADNAFVASSKQIVVLVPQFFNPKDRTDGGALETDLVFHSTSWADGFEGINPKKLGAENVSSFDVMEALIKYAMGKFPNAQRVVLGGHSMGAQLVHRFAVLRRDGAGPEVHYVPMNPGTWLYTNHSRIGWNDKARCPLYDDYKYGITKRAGAAPVPAYAASDVARLDRVGLTTRVSQRAVHVLVGERDKGAGDYSCEAFAQGSSHRQRGQLYVQSVIQSLPANHAALRRAGGPQVLSRSQGPGQAGVPARWSYDVVPGCSHDEVCMFNSYAGQKRLFLDGFPRTGKRSVDVDEDEEEAAAARRSTRARALAKPHVRAVHHHA